MIPDTRNTHNSFQYVPLANGRASALELETQSANFTGTDLFAELLNTIPTVLMVLNTQRQVVFANTAWLEVLHLNPDAIIGMRPGEVWGCLHATNSPGGCGTSEACHVCGAARAIVASINGYRSQQECRVIKADGGALDLLISSKPLLVGGEEFVVMTVEDISSEKRRNALESIFFHDVLNLAGVLIGYSELLETATQPQDVSRIQTILVETSGRLADEITMQRDLLTAERGDLKIHPVAVRSSELLSRVLGRYENHDLASSRPVVIAPDAVDIVFETDPVVLERVLGNMVKNALEASDPGQTITLNAAATGSDITFTVHNEKVMPREVQLQVFQRSFSTKGGGRGLGTYGMKLLTEQYLHGMIHFVSSSDCGTTFFATYPRQFSD